MLEFKDLDGLAGLGSLINGLLLWPIIRALRKADLRQAKGHKNHESRIKRLERK